MIRILLLTLSVVCSAVAPAVAQKVNYNAFVQSIEQALRLADEKGLDRAVRDNPQHAIAYFRAMNGALLRKADDAIALEQTAALRGAWDRVFATETLDYVKQWQDALDTETHARNTKAHTGLTRAYAEYDRLRNASIKERRPWESLRDSLLNIAEAFEYVGNCHDAADTWGLVAQVYTNFPDKTVAERRDSVYAIGRFKDMRDQWQFTTDTFYQQNVQWMEAEKARLASGEAEAEGGPTGDSGEEESSGPVALLAADADAREIVAELRYSVMKKPRVDMCVQGGPVPMLWAAVSVANAGPTKMPWFRAADLYVVRPSSSKFGITDDASVQVGSGKGWVDLEAANRVKKPSVFEFGPEGERREYAAWFYVGGGQEPFMGYTQNLAPSPENAPLYYKSAGEWTAKVEGTEIHLFDDNSNGLILEEDPFAYGIKDRHVGEGPTQEVPLPAFDGMQIGRGSPQPFSEWIQIGDQWFHLRAVENATKIGLRPADPEKMKTGEIQLHWNGPRNAKPEVLIVQGLDALSGARFNIASGKPMEVPAGRYAVAFGRLVSGKGARILTASVFGGGMEAIEVEEGETSKVEIGAPFTLDFAKRDVGAGAFSVDSLTIRVRGMSGELYAHINGAAPAPTVLIARDEEGHGQKEVGEFAKIRDPEVANQVASKHPELGNQVGFYAIADAGEAETAMEFDVPDGWFVGLKEAKNKLFGSLEPVFR